MLRIIAAALLGAVLAGGAAVTTVAAQSHSTDGFKPTSLTNYGNR